MCTHTYTYARARTLGFARVRMMRDRDAGCRGWVVAGKGVGPGYLRGRGDRSGQTDVPTSAGTPKTRRRRETRNPRTPSGQVFDCPACGPSSRGRHRDIAMEIDLSGRKVPEAAHGLVMEIRRATRH